MLEKRNLLGAQPTGTCSGGSGEPRLLPWVLAVGCPQDNKRVSDLGWMLQDITCNLGPTVLCLLWEARRPPRGGGT